MPLTHEAHLRTTLDSLFFKDALLTRIKTIEINDLSDNFGVKQEGETNDLYFDRILQWIDKHIGGYSISHVNGRFRARSLMTQDEVAEIQKSGRRYLVDETTAVTRFIFPYKKDVELKQIRYLFNVLFIQSIIQLVNGEDQIWMVESGPQNRVHIWYGETDDQEN